MKKEKDIFGEVAFDVPEGYFKDLQARLDAIPSHNAPSLGFARRFQPYLALAACFIGILIVGNVVLRGTTGETGSSDLYYNEIVYADLIPVTQPDEIFQTAPAEQDSLTDEDVIDWLIASGTSTEMIEYTGLIAQK